MRSGHTSTLVDDLGLVVIVGGFMKTRLVFGPEPEKALMGGGEGDIKVLVVKLPEMEVIQPEIVNWEYKGFERTSNGAGGGEGRDASDGTVPDAMAGLGARLPPTPPSRFRHSAVEARLPVGSRLAVDAFGDSGAGWGSAGASEMSESDHREGATVLVYGGYDGDRSVFGGRELLLLRVSRDGRRARWGECRAAGNTPPPVFHHTMTRLRRDAPNPRAVLIGGQSDDADRGGLLGGGAVYELDLAAGTWTRRETDGWPQPAAGHMTARWLHCAALRPEQAPDELHDEDKHVDVFTTQDRATGETLVHSGPTAPPWYNRPRRGEEIVIVAGFDDTVNRATGPMEPWVLCVDTWRWRLASAPAASSDHSRKMACVGPPPGRHRTGATVLGGRLMVIHGGIPGGAMVGGWLSDVAVLDLATLTWRRTVVDVDAHYRARHPRIAGHTMDAMMCFGGCKLGSWGIIPVSRMEFLMFGPAPTGTLAARQLDSFHENNERVKECIRKYTHVRVDSVLGRPMRILHHETKGIVAVPMEAHFFPHDDADEMSVPESDTEGSSETDGSDDEPDDESEEEEDSDASEEEESSDDSEADSFSSS